MTFIVALSVPHMSFFSDLGKTVSSIGWHCHPILLPCFVIVSWVYSRTSISDRTFCRTLVILEVLSEKFHFFGGKIFSIFELACFRSNSSVHFLQ